MKKAISIWCFPGGTSLEQAMRQARDAGFQGIELALNEEGDLALGWQPSQVKEVLALSKKIGIEISSLASGLGWKYPAVSKDAATSRKGQEVIKKGLEFGQLLGIDCFLSVPCTVGDSLSYDEAYEMGVKVYRELGRAAEQFGVTIGVENVWNKFLLSPLEFARFVDDVGHPLVQAYFDVGNVLVFGYPEQWIRILGKRIKKVHVKDFRRSVGNITGFTTLLNGDVNYPAVMKALREIGYDDHVIAEVGPANPACPGFLIEETARAFDVIFSM
jgi:hexulose-6-phosphate isomerase